MNTLNLCFGALMKNNYTFPCIKEVGGEVGGYRECC